MFDTGVLASPPELCNISSGSTYLKGSNVPETTEFID